MAYSSITTNPGTGGPSIAVDVVTAGDAQLIKLLDATTGSNNGLIINTAGSAQVIIPDVTATGSLTSATSVTLSALNAIETVSVNITGTWVGTVVFEATIDGTNFFTIDGVAFNSSGAFVTSTTANGQWQFNVAAVQSVRARVSTYTSGTVVITLRGTIAAGTTTLGSPLPAGGNIIGSTYLIDSAGVNKVTVKATTTQATTADTALVVAVSPNNTVAVTQSGTWNVGTITTIPAIPAGTNIMGRVGIDQTTPGTTNAFSLSQIGSTTAVTAGVAGALAIGGITAVNTTSTGNPEYNGGIAVVGTNPTKATTGQRTGMATDAIGRFIPSNTQERTLTGFQTTTIVNSSAATTIITAGAAGVFNDITHLSITNGTATACTATLISNGVTIGVWALGASGGISLQFPTPLAQLTAAQSWTITLSVATVTAYINAGYVKNI